VSCTAAGFKALTDRCVDFRARAEACELRLPASEGRIGQLEQALASCEARPPVPAPSSRPLVAVAVAVAGTIAAVAGIGLSDTSSSVRIALGAGGVLTVAAGVVLAAW
jgi:hypothetical protein